MQKLLDGTEDPIDFYQTRTASHNNDAIKLMLRRWTDFCTEYIPSLTTADKPFTRVPKPREIEAFLLHLARSVIKGKFETKATTYTMETQWHRLEQLVRRYLNHRYFGNERCEIRQFIRNALVQEEAYSGVPKIPNGQPLCPYCGQNLDASSVEEKTIEFLKATS
ncbi:hypothetical protein BST61_g9703 [Cercospora zeina]